VGLHDVGDALPDVVLREVRPGAGIDGVDVETAGADATEVSGEAIGTVGGAGEKMAYLEVGSPVVEDPREAVRRSGLRERLRGRERRRLRERLRCSGRNGGGQGPGRWRGWRLRGSRRADVLDGEEGGRGRRGDRRRGRRRCGT
jgi:hypothetical protein